MNKSQFTPEIAAEWERACERLKKSGYDLSKIVLITEYPGLKKKKAGCAK